MYLDGDPQVTASLNITISNLARWDGRAATVNSQGEPATGAFVVDSGQWQVAVGDCSASGESAGYYGGVTGLPNPHPCDRLYAIFNISLPISFYGG
eukprot:SAG31_NODE_6210_length_2120_cov_1.196932_3_plen_96_part_00